MKENKDNKKTPIACVYAGPEVMAGRAGDPEKDGGGTERPLYPRNRQDGEEEPPAQADIAMTAVYAGPVPARKKSLLARIGRLLGK